MGSIESYPEDFSESSFFPDVLPEPLSPGIIRYLQRSTALLKRNGIEKVIKYDYDLTYQNLHFLDMNSDTAYYGPNYHDQLDALEDFHKSDLPITVYPRENSDEILISLVKVDPFGEVFGGYCIELFFWTPSHPNNAIALITKENGLTNKLINNALKLDYEQTMLDWRPVLDLRRRTR
jgi:hypothetical protein